MGNDSALNFSRRFDADGFDWVTFPATALFLPFVVIQKFPLTSCSLNLINWLRIGVALLLLSLFGESPFATVLGMMPDMILVTLAVKGVYLCAQWRRVTIGRPSIRSHCTLHGHRSAQRLANCILRRAENCASPTKFNTSSPLDIVSIDSDLPLLRSMRIWLAVALVQPVISVPLLNFQVQELGCYLGRLDLHCLHLHLTFLQYSISEPRIRA